MLILNDLINAAREPQPYEPGEEFWNDPHISKKMLEAHLSAGTDAASYRPEKIQLICDYLTHALPLKSGDRVVDLGCGPGLYCSRLARQGLQMTGLDISELSIRYARNIDHGTQYTLASYLSPFGSNQFDAALMIWYDYGVLSPADRCLLLRNIRQSLKPNGYFVFDVPSMADFQKRAAGAASR